MPVDVEVKGGGDLRRRLGRVADAVETDLGYQEIGDRGVRLIGQFAPRRTGRLRRSWRPRVVDGAAEMSSRLVYAGVIDRGWPRHNIAPSRYTARAMKQLEREAGRIAERDVETEIRKAGL